LASLNEQKKAVKETLDATKAEAGLVEISDADIKRIIENLSDEASVPDPKRKRRLVQSLLEEVKIFPKEGSPWRRTLEIRGVYLPLTGVFVASPRGFEPLLPT
jgi:hypothetical protein